MMLCTSDIATLYGFGGTQASNQVVHRQTADPAQASKRDVLFSKFNDIFEKPSKPVNQTVDHKIKLLVPSASPQYPCLYHMSEDELKAVKATIIDDLSKGGYDQLPVYIWHQLL